MRSYHERWIKCIRVSKQSIKGGRFTINCRDIDASMEKIGLTIDVPAIIEDHRV